MPSFTEVLNLSISASWLVLAVAGIRLLLKRAPRAFHCALWALVAVRLLCPVSLESQLSLIPSREVVPQEYLYMEPAQQDAPAKLDIVTNPVYDAPVTVDMDTTVDRLQHFDLMGSVIWLAGMGAMAVYAVYSYLNLQLRVRMAAWVGGRVWECDELSSPFILGVLWPKIYLPSGLDPVTKAHVLAHEEAHLKRLDHLWKPLGFALLTVHWFNPVMWLGYILLCRDIELACDEKVIKKLDKPAVRAYSEALVACSVSHLHVAVCPLAFGEVGVKGRIKSMLNYKKPGFWILLTALLVSVVLCVCFLTDPAEKPDTLVDIRLEDGCTIVSQTEQTLSLVIERSSLPDDILNGKTHTFEPGQIVLARTDTTTAYVESGRTFGSELLLTIGFEYTIGDSGEILVPYRVQNGGREWTAETARNDKVRIAQYGPEPAISVAIDMEWFKTTDGVAFELTGMNLLRYRGDHLPPVSDVPPQLEAIVEGYGNYSMTECKNEPLAFMFYTHWIPEGFERGYDFSNGELVVLETENTRLQMTHAELDGEYYRFDFAFSYDLPASGTVIVPYTVDIKGVHHTLALDRGDIHDFSNTYDGDVELEHEAGTHSFSLFVKKEMYEQLDDYLWVSLEGTCALTYIEEGMELSFEDEYLIRERYEVGEYERFVITRDLHLIGCEPEILFPIERDLGALHVTNLEHTPVSEKLKKNNLWAWRCEAYGQVNLLLQQNDGTLYVCTLTEDRTAVAEQYRLENSGESHDFIDPRHGSHHFAPDITDSFDLPSFQLSSDGTFTFHISVVSSYIGVGSYSLSKEELILKTSDGWYIWCFDVTADGFAYDASRSSPISYMKTVKEQAQVPDGALFRAPEPYSYEPPELEPYIEDAISAAILSANGADTAHGSLCVESHRILAELAVCGVATADGGPPMEELIVYLYALYRERSTNGDMMYIEEDRLFPAELSFAMTEGGYALVEYRELTDAEAKEQFPTFGYEDLQAHRDQYDSDLSYACREKLEEKLAALQAQIAQAGELLEIIASSPAQYSYPGAYIDAHPEEWARLLELGAGTVHYSFQQLAAGEELGLKGYLMALASQEIIAGWGENCTVESYFSAQNWFSQFLRQAEHTADSMRWDEVRKTHPACTLAIVYTEYQEFPPP